MVRKVLELQASTEAFQLCPKLISPYKVTRRRRPSLPLRAKPKKENPIEKSQILSTEIVSKSRLARSRRRRRQDKDRLRQRREEPEEEEDDEEEVLAPILRPRVSILEQMTVSPAISIFQHGTATRAAEKIQQREWLRIQAQIQNAQVAQSLEEAVRGNKPRRSGVRVVRAEIDVVRHILLREKVLLEELSSDINDVTLKKIREISINIVDAVIIWHRAMLQDDKYIREATATKSGVRCIGFLWRDANYLCKMCTDLSSILSASDETIKKASLLLGTDARRLTKNPILLPSSESTKSLPVYADLIENHAYQERARRADHVLRRELKADSDLRREQIHFSPAFLTDTRPSSRKTALLDATTSSRPQTKNGLTLIAQPKIFLSKRRPRSQEMHILQTSATTIQKYYRGMHARSNFSLKKNCCHRKIIRKQVSTPTQTIKAPPTETEIQRAQRALSYFVFHVRNYIQRSDSYVRHSPYGGVFS